VRGRPGLGAGVKGAPGRRPGLNRGGGVLGLLVGFDYGKDVGISFDVDYLRELAAG